MAAKHATTISAGLVLRLIKWVIPRDSSIIDINPNRVAKKYLFSRNCWDCFILKVIEEMKQRKYLKKFYYQKHVIM